MVANHPNRADFRRDSEVAGRFSRGEHFKWTDVTCMIEAYEGVLHSSGKGFADVMLTDPLVVHRRIMTLAEF
ncbi:hypothetical protein VCRA2126O85_160024 [Vibrio crassostreae]|nr:hypothetical protein VCRA2128O106_150024 [Vibrio crassostreae]CAK2642760.1 hypothetical protein VCRA2125O83_150024 [Vibrio crassostreae]CAK2649992.1 hypothetical protein VCRA2126O84_160024 [Vibrio crassostreae]CAK2651945.1 hypothetical protein VCRA2128O100_160070 [Vibrio crassostreae]CAK2651953.1 hypothetical protein VCRA2127O91_160024 [Vibrio crassostreae]